MRSIGEPYDSEYLAGAVPIWAFTQSEANIPTYGNSYSVVFGNDKIASDVLTRCSYEDGTGGFGSSGAMMSSLSMNVTDIMWDAAKGGRALWIGFPRAGYDWKDPWKTGLWMHFPDTFTVERPVMTQNRFVDVKAYGFLKKFDKPISTVKSGTLTIKGELEACIPCTLAVFFAKLLECVYGQQFSEQTFTNSTYLITKSPFDDSSDGVTCRDVLDWIVAMTGCYVSYTPPTSQTNANVTLKTWATSTTIPLTNIAKMDVHSENTFVSKVTVQSSKWSVSQSATTTADVEYRELTIKANPLYECLASTGARSTVASNVLRKFLAKNFCEFDISVAAGLKYEVGDYVSFTDAKGKTRKGWLTYVKHTMGGLTELKCELAS